jgi:hypothetical protein
LENGDAMRPFVGLHGSNDFQLRKVHNRDCPGNEITHLWAVARLVPAGEEDGERGARSGVCAATTQKALTKMNIQLANVISDITGVSNQTIIGAILKRRARPLETGGSERRDGASSWRDLVVPDSGG